ncbi:MAG TPA: hypothetical protein DCE26_09880 [Dehalococcoidia bacterium]|nr:hypothetical protein [Dehalococcoidia bacterium]|tara:strand:- start:5664 stop:6386 length:723 start_codon:yes stop_codon:yes gene_type:complete
MDTKELTIPAGQTKTATFALVRTVGPSAEVTIAGLTKTLTVNEGILPQLDTGDTWELAMMTPDGELTATFEIIGCEGSSEYQGQMSFDPPIEGVLSSAFLTIDKQYLRDTGLEATGDGGVPFSMKTTMEYEPKDSQIYPLTAGKEVTVTEIESSEFMFAGEGEEETITSTYTYVVEGIEDVTVPADTFRAFKVVKYDVDGEPAETTWSSHAVKGFDVKSIDHEEGESSDLISYTLVGSNS